MSEGIINIYSTHKNGFEKLSNLLHGPVLDTVRGKLRTFKTVEHLYQVQKAIFAGDIETANKIYKAKSGWDAQKLSKEIKNLPAKLWDRKSSAELERIMILAFEQNEDSRKLLLDTGQAQLVHQNPHKPFMKLGKWESVFPEILMKIRTNLKQGAALEIE